MKKHWWKILAVLLMLYTIVAGMLIPLSPATHYIDGSRANAGETLQMTIHGYNTHYTQANPMRAWLINNMTFSICANEVEVIDDRTAKTSFTIPTFVHDSLKIVDFSLIVESEVDGYSVLPDAVSLVQQNAGRADTSLGCEVSGLHERPGTTFPFRNILEESIRSLYFHVPLWFAMMILMLGSVMHSIAYLMDNQDWKLSNTVLIGFGVLMLVWLIYGGMNMGGEVGSKPIVGPIATLITCAIFYFAFLQVNRRTTVVLEHNIYATSYARVGVLFGVLGLITGAIWAKHTWGAYWNWDVKQNTAAIAVLVYAAYFVLRDSFDDLDKKARISSVYNIFAFAALIPLLFVIPRLADSLHPGAGGNPALGSNDLDNTMRMVFYPGVIAMILIGAWISGLLSRIDLLKLKKYL